MIDLFINAQTFVCRVGETCYYLGNIDFRVCTEEEQRIFEEYEEKSKILLEYEEQYPRCACDHSEAETVLKLRKSLINQHTCNVYSDSLKNKTLTELNDFLNGLDANQKESICLQRKNWWKIETILLKRMVKNYGDKNRTL